jgi:hypothetical protein
MVSCLGTVDGLSVQRCKELERKTDLLGQFKGVMQIWPKRNY